MEIIFVDDLLYRLIISSEDQVNDFSFTDVQVNMGMALDTFDLDVPKGVEVIYNNRP